MFLLIRALKADGKKLKIQRVLVFPSFELISVTRIIRNRTNGKKIDRGKQQAHTLEPSYPLV